MNEPFEYMTYKDTYRIMFPYCGKWITVLDLRHWNPILPKFTK